MSNKKWDLIVEGQLNSAKEAGHIMDFGLIQNQSKSKAKESVTAKRK